MLGASRAVLSGLVGVLLTAAAAGATPEELARGELLFHIGGCTNCHTAKDGPLLAGGDPLVTPFGTFYAPNITPDPETGIGRWTREDFLRAMRFGKAPDGSPYYPAFPYTSYARMSDADLGALEAYLRTVPPVRRPNRAHELSFPYNLRWGLYLWQWLFHDPAPFRPDPARSETWNRGAYLVEGPGHCGECHTPRTIWGALDRDRAYAGGRLGKETIPNITSDPVRGIGGWSRGDLRTFLLIGIKPDGDFVGGEMAKVVRNGTAKLPEADREAIVEYLLSLPPR
ncbi:MAG: cytochrome c [Geminicoccaceae bacterium]|nr:cytochrome c [Geminicoccaceae bacterium]MCS7266905.1 cytochrome c [Geminicoccaceae bacterium]MCX7628830.1 cytochrome c [Geminicoccaceae bacterium]MDW8124171.1 cytochrome c [Geminicoccaceae bacterium]MDW8340606.1 cytochrome c [Geminicoccaceae bacterium]